MLTGGSEQACRHDGACRSGATEDERNRGTLVNALLHHFGRCRRRRRPAPGHRAPSRQGTSGLIVVAKNDEAHRRLATQFAARQVKKKYVALVHGWMKQERGTIRQQHQPRPRTTNPHDHAPTRRARSDQPLHSAATSWIRPSGNSPCSRSKSILAAPTRSECIYPHWTPCGRATRYTAHGLRGRAGKRQAGFPFREISARSCPRITASSKCRGLACFARFQRNW